MRPGKYCNYPVRWDVSFKANRQEFRFLIVNRKKESNNCVNSTPLDPVSLGIDWRISLGGVKQNRYYEAAEKATKELLRNLLEADGRKQGELPKTLDGSKKENKRQEILETSINCGIHMFHAADSAKIEVITKQLMLLFLHDDVIEYAFSKDGATLLEMQIESHEQEVIRNPKKAEIWAQLCRETLAADSVWGRPLLQSMVAWAEFTNKNQHSLNSSFLELSEYMKFRDSDVANNYIIAALRYSCEFELLPWDVEAVTSIEKLVRKHCYLTNDLYSFDKEQCENEVSGAALVNAVECLKGILLISTDAAKTVLLGLIWEVEEEMHRVYEGALASEEWTDTQIRYAQRLIEVAAGNAFYSATAYRYSKEAVKMHQKPCETDIISEKCNGSTSQLKTNTNGLVSRKGGYMSFAKSTLSETIHRWFK